MANENDEEENGATKGLRAGVAAGAARALAVELREKYRKALQRGNEPEARRAEEELRKMGEGL